MKRLTALIISIVLCASFVLAGFTTVQFLGASGDYQVTYQASLRQGWNLLPAEFGGDWSFAIDTTSETEFLQKIKAYYVYLPLQNKYVDGLGKSGEGFSNQDYNLVQLNKEYLQSSAAWYYITDPSNLILSYIVEDGAGMPKLDRGWNLLSVGQALSVLNNAVKISNKFPVGNCEVQQAYFWDSYEQVWESIGEADSLHDSIDKFVGEDAIGVGIAIKVKESCQLGTAFGTISSPPALPS